MRIIRAAAVIAAGGIAVGVIAGAVSEPEPAERPGEAGVYARIAAATDCHELQGEFDQADLTHKRGGSWGPIGSSYMEAADARMRQIGCYR